MFKQKSDTAATAPTPADAVQQARTKARQRLIGAVVLLGIGIIGFPLVFETQPRPIPVDIPIEIPRKDNVPPLVAPPAPASLQATSASSDKPASAVTPKDEPITESRSDAGHEVPAPASTSTRASATSPPAARASSAAVRTVPAESSQATTTPPEPARHVATPAAASSAKPGGAAEAERARALLEGRAAAAAAAESGRYVVQVGAFADAEAARETRQKVEKLGLKTYTQVAQTPGGSRIRVRVGPFASRGEADAALAKAKAAGLAAVVLTL